jgi:hypothetical protein
VIHLLQQPRKVENMKIKAMAFIGVSATLASIASTSLRADPQDTVDYRVHIMETIREQSEILGLIAQKKAPADHVVAHAQVLALNAKAAKNAFRENVPGGRAKPEVWSQALRQMAPLTWDLSYQRWAAKAVTIHIAAPRRNPLALLPDVDCRHFWCAVFPGTSNVVRETGNFVIGQLVSVCRHVVPAARLQVFGALRSVKNYVD